MFQLMSLCLLRNCLCSTRDSYIAIETWQREVGTNEKEFVLLPAILRHTIFLTSLFTNVTFSTLC